MNLTNIHDDHDDASFKIPVNVVRRNHTQSETNQVAAESSTNFDDLFGIVQDEIEMAMSRNKPLGSSTPRNTKQQPVPNDDDVGRESDDEDLGFDPRRPKASPKTNLFDDLLGGTLNDVKRPATAAAPTPAVRRREDRRPTISRQSTDTTTENSNALLSQQTRPKTSIGRRGSGFSGLANTDPLGLFSQTTKEPNQTTLAPKKRSGTATADWLGLNVGDMNEDNLRQRPESPKTPRVNINRPTAISSQPAQGYDILTLNETGGILPDATDVTLMPDEPPDMAEEQLAALTAVSAPTAQSVLHLNNLNLQTRGAIELLQQQDSQLRLTVQMKQQERALADMQRRQDTLLQQQERQFQSLMQQQMQRQQNLEESIKLQQQRISAHIQLMMTQPIAALEALPLDRVTNTESGESELRTANLAAPAAFDKIQIETDMKRLELEKSRLEELLVTMKANYDNEIEIIKNTNRKQIEMLEEHSEALETRLRAEIADIEEHYKHKLNAFEDEQRKNKTTWESENTALRQDHEDELRRLRKAHEEDLDSLRNEHRRMLESVQQAKMLEFAAMQDNSSYLDTLKAALANLTEVSGSLHDLREHLQVKLEASNQEKFHEIEVRERNLADKERRLKLIEDAAEEEKQRLMKLIGNLEQQMTTITNNSAEENWQLRLKLSTLEAEKAAFEREREYARDQMLRDEKRLADLKQQQLAEGQRLALELQEERRQLQIEKAKLETTLKLRENHNTSDRDRSELEAAIKVAREATRQSDEERERYCTLQSDLEQRIRDLIDAKSDMRMKQEKLNNELKVCSAAEQQAQDAARKARLVEQDYKEKLKTLQQRMCEVAEKMAHLAEERKLLAQQRIALVEVESKPSNGQGGELQELAAPTKAEIANFAYKSSAVINVVDRLLDENIAESLQRMHVAAVTTGVLPQAAANLENIGRRYMLNGSDGWSTLGLDDDSKSLALNTPNAFQLRFAGITPTQ